MEGLAPFFAALGLIAILELGDKTQLVTISLAMKHHWLKVLAGAALGLIAVTAIGAAIGGLLAVSLGDWLIVIKIVGGIVFIVIGVWTILRKQEESDETIRKDDAKGRSAVVTAFSLNFLAEFGDKTQLAVIVLAATNEAPVSVFLGAGLGLTLLALMSVIIGTGLARVLSAKWIRMVSAVLFIVAGVLLIIEAMLG